MIDPHSLHRSGLAVDTSSLSASVTVSYRPGVGYYYRFKRGDRVIWGRFKGVNAMVDSADFQRTVDYPDEDAPGYHIILDSGRVG